MGKATQDQELRGRYGAADKHQEAALLTANRRVAHPELFSATCQRPAT